MGELRQKRYRNPSRGTPSRVSCAIQEAGSLIKPLERENANSLARGYNGVEVQPNPSAQSGAGGGSLVDPAWDLSTGSHRDHTQLSQRDNQNLSLNVPKLHPHPAQTREADRGQRGPGSHPCPQPRTSAALLLFFLLLLSPH